MRRSASAAALVITLYFVLLSLAQAADLTVTIAGLRSTAGVVRLSVYNRAETFLEASGRIARHKASVTSNPMQVTFVGLDPGTYAISVVHDENNDGKLNRNVLGIPLEGYGFSNDAPVILGPPSFAQAAVPVGQENTTITVTMRY
jgi:uncharacterized protein (DUF2141 family)